MSAWRDDVWWARHEGPSLLDAALDAIARATFVVDGSGDVLKANALARALLADLEVSIRDTLRAVVGAGVGEHPGWSVTPVVTSGQGIESLVVARAANVGIGARIVQAQRQWGLTRRQLEVLAKIANGSPNKIIAASLGVSVRTVEVHLTALFTKACVTSRAELLVKLSTLE